MSGPTPYSVGLRPLEPDLHLPLTELGPPEMIEIEPIHTFYDRSLQDIWHGEEANRIRRMVQATDKACRKCDYFRFCIKSAEIDYDDPDNFFAQQQLEQPVYQVVPRLVEQGYQGFNLVQYLDKFWGLAQSVGAFDLFRASEETLQTHQRNNRCLIAESAQAVKEQIDHLGPAALSSAAPRTVWPSTMEGYLKQIAQGFQTDSEEGRRLRALYEELSEPPELSVNPQELAPPAKPASPTLHGHTT